MTTNTPATEQPTGKAFDEVNSFVKMVLSHIRCNSMKAHTAWMPASLYPNGKGGYAVLNINGHLIGENQDKKIPKDWVVNANDLELSNSESDEDGVINLFGTGYPWEAEGFKNEYLGRLIDLFKVPNSVVRSRNPIHKPQIYVGG